MKLALPLDGGTTDAFGCKYEFLGDESVIEGFGGLGVYLAVCEEGEYDVYVGEVGCAVYGTVVEEMW